MPTGDVRWVAGIDVGGTFTDLAATNGTEWVYAKVLSTPAAPERSICDALSRLASHADLGRLERIIHGSTIVPNTVIERKGATVAMVTTRGFRDTLSIGREFRFDNYDLSLEKAPPLCPRDRIFEVDERALADGAVWAGLDKAEMKAIAQKIRAIGSESVAVVFLHAYASPDHENSARQLIVEANPDVLVSCSHEVAPVIGEYVRSSTTIINAYVRPIVDRYLDRLVSALREDGFAGKLFLMVSQGGITDVQSARRFPVNLLEAGTSAGAIAAAETGIGSGSDEIVSFDIGGTTAKICVCRGGRPPRATELEIARQSRFKSGSGLPVRVDGIEMLEIGAGGGSIARVGPEGWLSVGPTSAGSDPGPACFGCGGLEPTVTDANLLLGYLDPNRFSGGAIPLSPALAEAAIRRLSDALGTDPVSVACAIQAMVNAQMADALRLHVIERGGDPRQVTIVAFGGGGPLHAYEVARLAGSRRIVVPPHAGIASAVGLLMAQPAVERSRTFHHVLGEAGDLAIAGIVSETIAQSRADLADRFGATDAELSCFAEMSYLGQGHEIIVELPLDIFAGSESGVDDERLKGCFEAEYRRRGAALMPNVPIQVSRLTVRGNLNPSVTAMPGPASREYSDVARRRPVYFAEVRQFVDTNVVRRKALAEGQMLHGPLLIEEDDTATVVGLSATVALDEMGNLILSLNESGRDDYEGGK